MISVQIEKEIKEENKIVGNFTLRQVICFVIAFVILGVYYYIVRPTMDMIVPVGIILGGGVWYFGFHKRNGMHTEYFVIKKTKEFILANLNRKYRTKNKYVTMLNAAYMADKTADFSDKKKKRYAKKQLKQETRRRKKSRIKAYA